MARTLVGLMSIALIFGAAGIASAADVPAEDFTGPEWVNDGDVITGTNGWGSVHGDNILKIGGGPGGFNRVVGSTNGCCSAASIAINGGPLTSGTIVTTFFSKVAGNITQGYGYQSNGTSRNFSGFGIEHQSDHDVGMEPITTSAGIGIGGNSLGWIQMRYTYDRTENRIQIEFREVDDTTGLPTGTGAYTNIVDADRDDHGLAAVDVTHFWNSSGLPSGGIALINTEIPEPAGLALIAAGGGLLLLRRRRKA